MTPLEQRFLAVDTSAVALANVLGRTDRAALIRQHLSELRVAVGRADLALLASHADQIEPADAVRRVIEGALRAGLGWPDLVAIVNTACERRV